MMIKARSVLSLAALAGLALAAGPEPRPAVLALVGDLMLGRSVGSSFKDGEGEAVFKELRPWLKSADAAFGNLESPVAEESQFNRASGEPAPDEPGQYDLCASSKNLSVLGEAGFDVLSTANNHRDDCLAHWAERSGSRDSERLVEAAGMLPVGKNLRPVEIMENGLRLAFLAADDVSGPVDIPGLLSAVKEAERDGSVVIVSLHWGAEYQAGESRRQRELAAQLAGAGARLIIGHHPHVIQPVECIPGGAGRGPTLVFYSLGNALFDQHGLPGTRQGLLAFVRLSQAGPIDYSAYRFQILKTTEGFRLVLEDSYEDLGGVCR